MDNDLKFVIEQVNKLLSRDYNVVSFNDLKSDSLLQLLCDVLNEIRNSDMKLNVQEQDKDILADNCLIILKNVGYPPNENHYFSKRNLSQGDKRAIHPVLIWIFHNFEKAKLRAYLAEYLIRIQVPLDLLQTTELNSSYKKYSELIENFKQIHSEWEQTKKRQEIAKNAEQVIRSLEKETKFLSSRVTDSREKIDRFQNKDTCLSSAEVLWNEHMQNEQLQVQMKNQQDLIINLESEYDKLKRETEELTLNRNSFENPVKRLEAQVSSKITNIEDMSKQVNKNQQQLTLLRQVVNSAVPTENDLNELRDKIDRIKQEISELEAKQGGIQTDKMAPYKKEYTAIMDKQRQLNASIVSLRAESSSLDSLRKEKQSEVDKVIGHEVKRGIELKQYIRDLRDKNTKVDGFREKISAVKSEHEVLLRTMEVLKRKFPPLVEFFESWKPDVNSSQKDTLSELQLTGDTLAMCSQLKLQVDSTRADLSALENEEEVLKQKVASQESANAKQREMYLSKVGDAETNVEKAKREMEDLKSSLNEKEQRWKAIQKDIEMKESTLNGLAKLTKTEGTSLKQKELNEKLIELENESRLIEKERKELESTQAERYEICKNWKIAIKILTLKTNNSRNAALNDEFRKYGNGEVLTLK